MQAPPSALKIEGVSSLLVCMLLCAWCLFEAPVEKKIVLILLLLSFQCYLYHHLLVKVLG